MGILSVAGLFCSMAIGLSLGLIGGGGSIITVPVLVCAIGLDPHQSIGISLAVVGATHAIGSWLHHRRGAVSWKTGAIFAGGGIFGALFGTMLSHNFSPETLRRWFAAFVDAVALFPVFRNCRAVLPG